MTSASLERFTEAVLSELGAHQGTVGLALLVDPEVQALNRCFRGHDRPTDVLSFPCGERLDGELHLGDIVIGLGVAMRQARARRQRLATEVRRLLLHGLLHLLGYDHESDRGEMAALERRLWHAYRSPSSWRARLR